jgi:hypothetical protein
VTGELFENLPPDLLRGGLDPRQVDIAEIIHT